MAFTPGNEWSGDEGDLNLKDADYSFNEAEFGAYLNVPEKREFESDVEEQVPKKKPEPRKPEPKNKKVEVKQKKAETKKKAEPNYVMPESLAHLVEDTEKSTPTFHLFLSKLGKVPKFASGNDVLAWEGMHYCPDKVKNHIAVVRGMELGVRHRVL